MATMDIREIMDILPHKYPMLMVDKIVECDDKKHIVGVKNVTCNEPFFQGHFPTFPVMPGVLQLEAMAQVGGILLSRLVNVKGVMPLFLSVDKAKFRKRVGPGDQMRIEVEIINSRANTARMHGKITVDGGLATEAELLFMLTKEKI